MFLPRVIVELAVLPKLGLVLTFTVIPVRHMHDHHEGGAGHENELQGPQANVGDGEEVVVADVGTARLLGVAVKVPLVVPPHPLGCHHIHHHPEDEHHRQPQPPKRSGVLVDPTEESLEGLPVHLLGC